MPPKTKDARGRKTGNSAAAAKAPNAAARTSATRAASATKAVAAKSATAKASVARATKGRVAAKPTRAVEPPTTSRAAARSAAQPASLKRTSAAQPAARGSKAIAASARAKAGATKAGATKAGATKAGATKAGATKAGATKSTARSRPATAAARPVASKQAAKPATARAKASPNPTRQAATTAAVSTERKAKMPTKKNVADATPADMKTTKAATPMKPAAAPGKAAAGKSSATRHAAAAFVAARKKMSSAAMPTPAPETIDAVKGVVQLADKSTSKTVDDHATPAPDAPAVAAEAPVQPHRPGLPPRPAALAPKPVKPGAKAPAFKTNEFIVYPAHGVGEIIAVESQEVAGYKLELFVISFIKDKMILKVPLPKAASVGMRKLADPVVMKRALDTLTGRARVKRTMWSRRAQEYEAKINSGDLVAIAEVVRDLYRSDAQPEQSYSERQLYEAALDRMARELAAVQKLTDTEALKVIDTQLQKGPRRTKGDEAESEETEEDGGIVEAA